MVDWEDADTTTWAPDDTTPPIQVTAHRRPRRRIPCPLCGMPNALSRSSAALGMICDDCLREDD